MILDQWAKKWGIPTEALAEFKAALGVFPEPDRAPSTSEAAAQKEVQLEASRNGHWLTRNNVGALLDQRGVPVRYGLANETREQNRVVKSSDLIGIKTVAITPEMVGQKFGQFLAREIKRPGWRFSGSDHETAQLNFLRFVLSRGGDAAFATGEGTL